MRSHTVVHLEAGAIPAKPLSCEQANRAMSFRIVDGAEHVWLTGTAEDFQLFADDMQRLADLVRTAVFEEVS